MDAASSTPVGAGPATGDVPPRKATALAVLIGLMVVVIIGTSLTSFHSTTTLAVITSLLILAAWRHALLAWPTLLGLIIVVILFIPMRKYTLGGGLPIALEPYRLIIAVIIALWFAALLVDPDTRARATGLEAPLLLLGLAILGSIVINVRSINAQGISADVFKQLSFFVSFFLVTYFAASAVTTRQLLDRMIMLTVAGGTFVACSAIVESATSINIFNDLNRVIPILHEVPGPTGGLLERGGRVRAMASAQHPIALGALLVMLLPFAMYLFRLTDRLFWLGCAGALTLGALSTGSRTGALMLVVLLVVFFWLKRAETTRMLPMLLPLIVVCQVIMPGTLGTFKATIFPQNGSIISEQQGGGTGTGTGRIADLGPSLKEWSRKPLLGEGFGTRLTSPDDKIQNARILDDEWLSFLLEVGIVGVFALIWLYGRAVRRLAAEAKPDSSPRGWLLTAFAAATTSFAFGMLTFDGFSFIQVTFLSFVILGLGEVALRVTAPVTAPAPVAPARDWVAAIRSGMAPRPTRADGN